MKNFTLFSIAVFACFTLQAAPEIPTGCEQARHLNAAAYVAWISTPMAQVGAATAALGPQIELATHTTVGLIEDVTNEFHYMGYVRFHSRAAGDYSLATDSDVHFDVADLSTQRVLEALDFQKVHDCDTIRKTVRFHIEADRDYALRISGSDQASAQIMAWSFAQSF